MNVKTENNLVREDLRNLCHNAWGFLKKPFVSILIVPVVIWLVLSGTESHMPLYFSLENQISDLKDLLRMLSGSFVGGTALIFSLIIFSMQINIERLPSSLFQKISLDKNILFLLLIVFILGLVIGFLSLMPDKSSSRIIMLVLILLVYEITIFIYYIYKRILLLISPAGQTGLLVANANKKHYIKTEEYINNSKSNLDDKKDWVNESIKSINNIFYLVNFYAGRGDFDASQAALDGILVINKNYVDTLGGQVLESGRIITTCLESFRKYFQKGITLRDEQYIIHLLVAETKLFAIYFNSRGVANFENDKKLVDLCFFYLLEQLKSVIPYDMPEVLMQGLRSAGEGAVAQIEQGNVQSAIIIIQKISDIASSVALKPMHEAVIMHSVQQLADVNVALLGNNSGADDFKSINESYMKIAYNIIATNSQLFIPRLWPF